MGKGKDLDPYEIGQIEGMLEGGLSYRKIMAKTGVSLGAISNIKSKIDADIDPTANGRQNGGRRRKTTPREDRLIIKLALSNRSSSYRALQEILGSTYSIPLSIDTIRRRLKEKNIKHSNKAKKFLLNKKMMLKRRKWASNHRLWGDREWSHVRK